MIEDKLLEERPSMGLRCAVCSHEWVHVFEQEEEDIFNQRRKRLGIEEPSTEVVVEPFEETTRKLPIGWAAYAFTVVMTGALLLFGRDFLIVQWPPMTKFYEIFADKPLNADTSLSIEQVDCHFTQDGGGKKLMVTGLLKNTSDRSVNIPLLKMLIHETCEKGHCSKKPVVFKVSEERLMARGEIHFESPQVGVPKEGSKVTIEF
ncbi:MAG: hypothetical protein BGO28_07250 [Alphaproteobacteria bacterium 43-37]|nr:MAG: hypothetical protein BGO28_07250 [Alphaproteobacteria bacterium 43-37]